MVDGETFNVQQRDNTVDLEWLTGLNEGYGFSGAAETTFADEELREFARSFLGPVNPATGYTD